MSDGGSENHTLLKQIVTSVTCTLTGDEADITEVEENIISLITTDETLKDIVSATSGPANGVILISAKDTTSDFSTTATIANGSGGAFEDTSATVVRTQVVTYDVNSVAEFDKMTSGDKVLDGFTYKALDSTTLNDHKDIEATKVVVTVSGANDRPDAVNETEVVDVVEDGASVSIDVLANDTDADEVDTPETLIINSAVSEKGAVVTISTGENPEITYNPGDVESFQSLGAGETTTDTVTYTIRDAAGAISKPATVQIKVTGTNDDPVVKAEIYTAFKGDALTVKLK
jgi:VCBS repeat-containing protein